MKGRSGFGLAFSKRLDNEDKGLGTDPLGGQLESWITFSYFPGERRVLNLYYVQETIRCDIPRPGVFVVSACRRTGLTRWLERWFPGLLWYGKREVIEIHVRRI